MVKLNIKKFSRSKTPDEVAQSEVILDLVEVPVV